MRIYVASSWRNELQPEVVRILREAGNEVYDFRQPAVEGPRATESSLPDGFHWSQIDPNWQTWTPRQYRSYLRDHDLARRGFEQDMDALLWCDYCLLVMPAGRSRQGHRVLLRGRRRGRAGADAEDGGLDAGRTQRAGGPR